ncbi:pectinesterase family protein [Pseudoduganella sp. LjRoot289]|uniref:pectinesterase family protein n=1 Tax=Pseudoduganella sp. LjRoot289 TaxID=3342314 RepID=UPI003ECD77C9
MPRRLLPFLFTFAIGPALALAQEPGLLPVPGTGKVQLAGIAATSATSATSAAPADSYVESRFRPMEAGGGQFYVVGRYRDEGNWVGAGLAFTPGGKRMQVEIVRMQDGVLTRLKQFGRETAGDGRLYAVRLEMAGAMLTVYLNGEKITSVMDKALPRFGDSGVIASGVAFEASAPATGNAADKPARIALARAPQRLRLQAGEAPARLLVSALGPGDGAPMPFTACAGDAALLRVEQDGGELVLTPLASGATTLSLASARDPNVFNVVEVMIEARPPAAAFALAATSLGGAATPEAGARDIPYDTPLRLRFDQPPALGTSGAIRVLRKRDNALADTIRVADEYDVLGYEGQEFGRAVRRQPIAIEGRNAVIHLHSARLQPGEEYYVTIDAGVFAGALNGRPFGGVAKEQGWTFRTRSAVPQRTRITVDDDGAADFRTVQGALNHVMRQPQGARPVTVAIRDGRYQELLYLRGRNAVTLRGQSRDGVVIEAANGDGINPGSGAGQAADAPAINGGRALFLVEDADLLTLDTLTLRNSAVRASPGGGQAEALFFSSEGRLAVKNAGFYSEQDTVQVKGYAWFYRTLIAGNVDYVWGNNHAALFEESELRTLGDSANPNSGGYVLQARTVGPLDKGFVFLNSRLTRGRGPTGNQVPDGATWLARSAGYDTSWDHVAFINCKMDAHIAPAGWAGKGVGRQPAPNPAQGTAAAGWREYGSTDMEGKPLDLGARRHVRLLTAEEAAAQFGNRAAVFAGYGGGSGWNPMP